MVQEHRSVGPKGAGKGPGDCSGTTVVVAGPGDARSICAAAGGATVRVDSGGKVTVDGQAVGLDKGAAAEQARLRAEEAKLHAQQAQVAAALAGVQARLNGGPR